MSFYCPEETIIKPSSQLYRYYTLQTDSVMIHWHTGWLSGTDVAPQYHTRTNVALLMSLTECCYTPYKFQYAVIHFSM